MSCIKLHVGKFNLRTRDIREGIHRLPGMNLLSVLACSCDIHNLNEMSANSLYDLSVNGLNILSINVHPFDVSGLHELSVNGLNTLSAHICKRGVGESGDTTLESGINGLNVMNGLGPELVQ